MRVVDEMICAVSNIYCSDIDDILTCLLDDILALFSLLHNAFCI